MNFDLNVTLQLNLIGNDVKTPIFEASHDHATGAYSFG